MKIGDHIKVNTTGLDHHHAAIVRKMMKRGGGKVEVIGMDRTASGLLFLEVAASRIDALLGTATVSSKRIVLG